MGIFGFQKGTGSFKVGEIAIEQGELLSGWDFTSGWTTNGSTVVDANTFTVADATARGIRRNYLTIGKRYKCRLIGTHNSALFNFRAYSTADIYYDDTTGIIDVTFEFTAHTVEVYLEMDNDAVELTTCNITSMTLEEIPALPELDKGAKYLECTSAGTIAIPFNHAYETIEFDIYKGNTANTFLFNFIQESISTSHYAFGFNANEAIYFAQNASILALTANSYAAINTWYRIRVTRTKAGVFYFYIKGGSFGSEFILIDISGGSGANPATNTTVTGSLKALLNIDVGDRFTKFKWKDGIPQ